MICFHLTRQRGDHEFTDSIYDRTVNILQECADLYIPKHTKCYYKFSRINYKDQEFDVLKEKAISSNKVWKAARKPHSRPIFQQRQ